MQSHLLRAADAFEQESTLLAKADKLLSWGSPEGPDPARDAAAHALLTQCATLYAQAIAHLEQAIA